MLTQLSDNIWVSSTPLETTINSDLTLQVQTMTGRRSSNEEMRRPLSDSLEQLINQVTITEEQRAAIRVMINSHYREAFTAVSLSASRGRGKSSVMGIAAACYLLSGEREVMVTAPSEYACEAIFARARECLNYANIAIFSMSNAERVGESGSEGESGGEEIRSSLGIIRFITPRELWRGSVHPHLLLVDEAAALPVPFLERLLRHKPSLVFATTTHGYEGSGRGFSLRFRPILQKRLRKLYEPKLTEPLRWGQGDPVERWSSEALLLETKLPRRVRYQGGKHEFRYERYTAAMIAQYPERYTQVFALLVNAHYRTRPSDLWRLLDAPNLSVHILIKPAKSKDQHHSTQAEDGLQGSTLQSTGQVLAAAIVSSEGELTSALAAELYEGRQRPRGQLFAANLAVHLNSEVGATLKLARVIRIATLPLIQGRGLGQQLLLEIKRDAQQRGVDILGSSFGATHPLVRFWLRADFIPLRVSVRQSHVSGERSLLVVYPISDYGHQMTMELIPELTLDLEDQLRGAANDISPELTFILLGALATRVDNDQGSLELELSDQQWRSLGAIAFSGRAFELAARPARQLALHWLRNEQRLLFSRAPLTPLGRLLIMKVIQGRGWMEVTSRLELGSTSESMKGLSASLRLLYTQLAPTWALEWVRRFPQYHRPATLSHVLMPLRLTRDIDT